MTWCYLCQTGHMGTLMAHMYGCPTDLVEWEKENLFEEEEE